MSAVWTDYDEGYVTAEEWSRALRGGAELPVEESQVPLEPGEVAHAHLSPFTLAAYVAGGFSYQPIFGIFVTGEVALGRRTAWRAGTHNAPAPRWHRVGIVDLVLTSRRVIVSGSGKAGALGLDETGLFQLVPGMDGGPAVQLQPEGYPALQLASPWAPVLYVFACTLTAGRPPDVPIPAAVLEHARAEGRLA